MIKILDISYSSTVIVIIMCTSKTIKLEIKLIICLPSVAVVTVAVCNPAPNE